MPTFDVPSTRIMINAFRMQPILWVHLHPAYVGKYPNLNARTAEAWNAVYLAVPDFSPEAVRGKMSALLAKWRRYRVLPFHGSECACCWQYAIDFVFLNELRMALYMASRQAITIIGADYNRNRDVYFGVEYCSQPMMATYKVSMIIGARKCLGIHCFALCFPSLQSVSNFPGQRGLELVVFPLPTSPFVFSGRFFEQYCPRR